MKSSKRSVNFAIRSRNSSKPKFIFGSESAIDGASAEERGARMMLVDNDGSNIAAIMIDIRL